jgi:hypothetical protein
MPTTDDLAAALTALGRRVTTTEARISAAENRLAASQNTVTLDLRANTAELKRIADLLTRNLAATNQLGTLLASADIVQASRATPTTPWKPV